ncbi:MAG: PAS domain S-box protein [Spirulina sp. SIO3F2]|nr:PAS domain S-box protein [Spirulina sp. SIO3F2]
MTSPVAPIVTPPHIYYLVVNADFNVVAGSREFPDAIATTELALNIPVFDVFPELYGCEEIIEMILEDPASDFNLPGITRIDELTTTECYFDLYLQHYIPPGISNTPYLLIFAEDVTDKMALEQVLVQTTNETTLLNDALKRSRNYTHQIVTSIADALIVTNPEHQITTINQATAKLFGYAEADLIDQPLARLFVKPDQVMPILTAFLAERQTEAQTLEVLCQTQDGIQLTVALSCSLVHPPSTDRDELANRVPNLVYIGRDVTERQRTQQRLTAQYAIARILSESGSLDHAIQDILQAIGESLEWDVGEFWAPKGSDDRRAMTNNLSNATWLPIGQPCPIPVPKLQRMDSWLSDREQFAAFVGEGDRTRLNEGGNFAAQVWSAGQPQWITALQGETTFGKNSATVLAGLRSAFAFPIHSGSEMLGVMTFFRCSQQSPDEHLLEMMTATGNQLGQFIKRKEAEIALQKQQVKTERLLLNILPSPIVDRLKANPETIADSFEAVTVLFADLVGFTEIAARLSPIELVERLNVVFSAFDHLCEEHNLEKIKTIGDAYMVVGGLPTPRMDHAEAIAHMALDMQSVLAEINRAGGEQFKIRIGINTGSVVAGVIGTKKFIYDLWGDTVNIASRMESHGEPQRIQVTESTYHCLRDCYNFTPREQITVKGKGLMQTYWLEGKRSLAHA